MALQSSQRLPELLFYTKKSYKILQLQFQLQFQLQSYTCIVQRILHAEDKELFEYYNPVIGGRRSSRNASVCLTRHSRQLQLLQRHSRDIPDIPVIHDLPAFQAILQCSSISRESTPFQHSPIRMHILQFYSSIGFQKTPPSTSWAITDITNIHSFFKEREMLRYRSRCQDDIFPRIELIPSFVLSSDNTNCKNDIQLFHQLFDELSVYRDYH